jgi:hypothetical protein
LWLAHGLPFIKKEAAARRLIEREEPPIFD